MQLVQMGLPITHMLISDISEQDRPWPMDRFTPFSTTSNEPAIAAVASVTRRAWLLEFVIVM